MNNSVIILFGVALIAIAIAKLYVTTTQGGIGMALSIRQRDMLKLLATERRPQTGNQMMTRLFVNHGTVQSLHQTAAGLVHRGLAVKEKTSAGVAYQITEAGKAQIGGVS